MDTQVYSPSDVAIGSLTFTNYTSEEIRRLSVKEITSAQAIDRLGNPVAGGPYDLALGPFDKNDRCFTCYQGFVQCPGHLGHIQLILPVYNPVFFRNLVNLLRGCCLHCHTVLCSSAEKYLFSMQMLYLEVGQQEHSQNLVTIYNKWVLDKKALDTFYEHINEYIAQNPFRNSMKNVSQSCKNLCAAKQDLINDFEYKSFKTKKKFCPNCTTPVRQLRADGHCKLFYSQAVSIKQIKAYQERLNAQRRSKQFNGDSSTIKDEEEVIDDKESVLTSINEEVSKMSGQLYMTPLEVLKQLDKIWLNEKELLGMYLSNLRPQLTTTSTNNPMSLFFFESLPVIPSKFRPVLMFNDQKFENPKTLRYSSIVEDNQLMKELLTLKNQAPDITATPPPTTSSHRSSLLTTLRGATTEEKLNNLWIKMQITVNSIFDSALDKRNARVAKGFRQVVEKKEGLFRMHMMGKRVNYAGRSVISPDPFIATYEVGIPEVFAKKLTYPETVTPNNVHQLRKLILNGPDFHPGANFVELEDGTIRRLLPNNLSQRQAVAKLLLTKEKQSAQNTIMTRKRVYRHLRNGDFVLVNRQPTLHRPSIQAHMARVLPGEKTLRLHYAQCKSYNADFDGDEMNVHLLQNEVARAEAAHLMIAYNHYLVPKDGTPLTGLIQDHVVSGTSLTFRDRFFEKSDYQQLVFSSIGAYSKRKIRTLPPTILKPKELWTGKQIISTILLYIQPPNEQSLNLDSKSKLAMKSWPSKSSSQSSYYNDLMSDTDVLIRRGHLLSGLIDKAHCGSTLASVVHCYYELYGKKYAADLLSAFSKLFTIFLQYYKGFTLGIEDVLLLSPGLIKRRELIDECRANAGRKALQKTFQTDEDQDDQSLMNKFSDAFCSLNFAKEISKEMDLNYKTSIDEYQNQIIKHCMANLFKTFPDNNLQFLIQSGAKGSAVNAIQISCLLGQQELEGKRPPLMPSGRTLPSFQPYDFSPRSGGFVDGSFLSGIRPQEYFFHCMAGREGLIDTAVKTARIGYLQRCLMKHLEGLVVNYDLTVRDSDGSVIQFQYGEDGLAVDKCTYLKEQYYPFLINNYSSVVKQDELSHIRKYCYNKKVIKQLKKIRKWRLKTKLLAEEQDPTKVRITPFTHFTRYFDLSEIMKQKENDLIDTNKARQTLVDTWRAMSDEDQQKYDHGVVKFYSPITLNYLPTSNLGAITEHLDDLIQHYIQKYGNEQYQLSSKQFLREITSDQFETMLHLKSLKSCVDPGESVGILAAQSIGEPSTQMTLNTFHFAGRGEMNVTLGVPRLREILMVASTRINTPMMEVPILTNSLKKAKKLQKRWSRILFREVISNVSINERLILTKTEPQVRECQVKFEFFKQRSHSGLKYSEILKAFEHNFLAKLVRVINKKIKELTTSSLLRSAHVRDIIKTTSGRKDDDEGTDGTEKQTKLDDDLDDEDVGDAGEANAAKEKSNRNDEKEYEDGNEEEKEEEQDDDEKEELPIKKEEKTENDEMIDDGYDLEPDTEQPLNSEQIDMDENETASNGPTTIDRNELGQASSKRTKNDKIINDRTNFVFNYADYISDYLYCSETESWCSVTFKFPCNQPRIDLETLIRQELSRIPITSIQGINHCFISDSKENKGEYLLTTEGENIRALFVYYEVFDLKRLYTNNIHVMASTFGIEAANRTLIREINRVFGAYGIEVDYRHLSLLADYMTYEGVYKACNRIGLKTNSSPLQKITFETSTTYLKEAILHGEREELKSPSARLVTGRMVQCGTGTFDVLTRISK
ncbi:unnamed protein product [Didymodactylos carnosus]|uniref:DNA-directed RNA polymerase subunit n=1 Tax=Didymodactylos carnosus TaxID=1234261 RepID=A0A8S2IAF8_9BILA|nr:unnamed protein product [Didymodactylos carnosus]CAF3721051.1 unnamed protein product [Didymodactylos carnosus]